MRTNILFILLITIFFISCDKDDITNIDTSNEVLFLNTSRIIFTSQQESSTLMGTSDVYSKKLSPFDIKSKTHNINSNDESDYLQYAASQAKSWTASEIDEMKIIIASAESKIMSLELNLELPIDIRLVKSSMEEEGGVAGYTRLNYMVLQSTTTEALFLHELFHIYSRANPVKRDELYKTINFEKCNSVSLPDAIKDGEITNPDAPFYEHFLSVQIDGEQKDVIFIIYSEDQYNGGSFFSYLNQKLMLVEGGINNKTPILGNNYPILKDFSDASNINALIGNNTNYNIHPEEMLADHFTLLILQYNVPDQSFLDKIEQILK